MEIVNPSVESWLQNDTLEHIARCARAAYVGATVKLVEHHRYISANE